MFFKNAIAYRFTDAAPKLSDESLVENKFTPCGRQDIRKCGWGAPFAGEETFVSQIDSAALICMVNEEKILPASVIREKLQEKIETIEAQEDRRVYRKEKETLKDEIMFDCLPQAFTKKTKTYAYIDYTSQLLVVDSSSYGRAEELMKLLRDSLGSLPVAPVQVSESPAVIMTGWLRGETLPEELDLGKKAMLQEQREDGARAKLDKQDLLADEIESALNSGKQVVSMELDFDESVTFTALEDLRLKSLKFADIVQAESRDSADGDKKLEHYSDLALMTLHLRRLFNCIQVAFGGQRKEAA